MAISRKVIDMKTFALMMTMVLLLTSAITIVGNESKVFAVHQVNTGGGDKSGGDKGSHDNGGSNKDTNSGHDVGRPSNSNLNENGKGTNNNNNNNVNTPPPHVIDSIQGQNGGIPGHPNVHPPVTEYCHLQNSCPVATRILPPASLTTGTGTTAIGKTPPIIPTPIIHHHSKSYTTRYNQGWALSCRDDMSNTLLKQTGPHTKAFMDGYNDARIGDGPCP